jgi:hypothetical protein
MVGAAVANEDLQREVVAAQQQLTAGTGAKARLAARHKLIYDGRQAHWRMGLKKTSSPGEGFDGNAGRL